MSNTENTASQADKEEKPWSLFSRYGHILICLAENPDIRVSELAQKIGVTERSARGLVDTLEKNEVVRTTRIGRNNRYAIDDRVKLVHPLESFMELQGFLDFTRSARNDDSAITS